MIQSCAADKLPRNFPASLNASNFPTSHHPFVPCHGMSVEYRLREGGFFVKLDRAS